MMQQQHSNPVISPTTTADDGHYGFGASPKTVQPFHSARSGHTRKQELHGKTNEGASTNTKKVENLMYDKRVKPCYQTRESTRQFGGRKTMGTATNINLQERISNVQPRPPENNPIDLTPFLVEQNAAPEKVDKDTEVDEFWEQPIVSTEKHDKRGVDAATQIEQEDLWDFALAVEPLLEVIVGKTLEQAMREVSEEEELEFLKKRGYDINQSKKREIENVESLEKKAKRLTEVKNNHLKTEQERREQSLTAKRKIASLSAAKGVVEFARQASIVRCKRSRHFLKPEELVFENSVASKVYGECNQHLHNRTVARRVVDLLMQQSVSHGIALHIEYIRRKKQQEREEVERLRQRALKRKYKIRITINPPQWLLDKITLKEGGELENEENEEDDGTAKLEPKSVTIGPISVRRVDTVSTVQGKLRNETTQLVQGNKELSARSTGEDEEETLELGNIQWLRNVELQLFMHNTLLDPAQTLESYDRHDLLKGLGVRVIPKQDEEEDSLVYG